MAKRRERKEAPGGLRIALGDPGMTLVHRVGLAGLWMTLEAIEGDSGMCRQLEAWGTWERNAREVQLSWENGKRFFETLFQISFGLERQGFFFFPALGDPMQHPAHAVVLQEAILNTVLQHARTRKVEREGRPFTFRLEEEGEIIDTFRPVHGYAHQKEAFDPFGANQLVGWLFPGGVTRHEGTELQNEPGLALALRYLIVGAIYFKIEGGGIGRAMRS